MSEGPFSKQSSEPLVIETITQAVFGKTSAPFRRNVEVALEAREQATQVLGSHVNNPVLETVLVIERTPEEKVVKVTGKYDLHIWCMGARDSFVVRTPVHFEEDIPVRGPANIAFSNLKARVRFHQPPACHNAVLAQATGGQTAQVQVEMGLSAEVYGEANLLVYAGYPAAQPARPGKPRKVWPMMESAEDPDD